MRIRSHLLLLTVLVLVPGFFSAIVAVNMLRESERETALRGLHETVRATALLVDSEIQRSLGALDVLVNSEYLQSGDFASLHKQAAQSNPSPDVWTLVLNEAGQQLLNTKVPYGTTLPLPSPAAKSRVDAVRRTHKPLVSDLIVGPATGQLVTTVYVPSRPTPAGQFVVARAFSVSHWHNVALRAHGLEDSIIAIFDRDGKFIWRSHRATEFVGRHARPELVAAANAASKGMIRHTTLEGMDAYDAYSTSELTGWTIAVATPVPKIEASATLAVAWLAAGMMLAFALALLGARLLSRMLLSAIDTVSRAAAALGRGEQPVPKHTAVFEVDALHAALGNAARLLDSEQAFRKAVELEREQLLENERLARERAQRENLAKDKFLAMLGHELRNPLAAISGAAEVLARRLSDVTTQERFIAVIQRQAKNMVRIVDDLLEVSRMVSGKIKLETQALELSACVRSCVESLSVSSRGGSHQWNFKGDEVWVLGDEVRLEQVFSNLAVNALQFSPPNGKINISVVSTENHAVVEITDFGPGIPSEILPKIFEPFFQGQPLAGHQSSGLGIGLSLARQLVELHGGTIHVRSGISGTGSIFTVRLPRINASQTHSLKTSSSA